MRFCPATRREALRELRNIRHQANYSLANSIGASKNLMESSRPNDYLRLELDQTSCY